MISYIISRLVIQVFGTLYPAYSSYKTVRTKNVRGYVQWMKYWIVFAFLSCVEPFCDFCFSFWVPFYYESKILIVAWLLCPATRGYNYLYRAFVHPTLMENEEYIDDLLSKIKQQCRQAVLNIGTRGSAVMVQTMLKGVLSRTSIGSCFSRSNSFMGQTYDYGEIDERALFYHHQPALIRTLYLAENRRNSDPTVMRQAYNETSTCVQIRRNRDLANFESVRFSGDERSITARKRELVNEKKTAYRASGENLSFSLETLEEFDERFQNLPPLLNHRLIRLARKLSSEGFSDAHIGTIVSTLVSDLDPSLPCSSEESAAISSKNDEGDVSSMEEPSELENQNQFEEELQNHKDVLKIKNDNKCKEHFEKSIATSDSKQSRAGRYRKLRAPSPPGSKKFGDRTD